MHKNKFYVLGSLRRSVQIAHEQRSAYGKARKPKAISLFSGAMGLDLGLEASGFEIAGCLDNDKWACETIRLNRPDLPVVEDSITNWTGKELLSRFGIPMNEVALIAGGPPCPSFSTAGKRQSFNDPRGQVMFDFLRIVGEIRPPFFVMENVRGILSASIRHVPFAVRNANGAALEPEEQYGSVLRALNETFKRMGYTVTVELVNAANYGVPQKRERVVFLASKEGFQVRMPVGEYTEKGGLFQKPWRTLRHAIGDLKDPEPKYIPFSPARLKYLRLLREGENWRNLPQEVLREALGGAYKASGGKVGFFRRLSFDKPCPTVPTSPIHKSTCLCHPAELRPLTVKEYARVQQFPDDWKFAGSIAKQYEQIGNAVPVGLGHVIGRTILQYLRNYEEV